MPQVFRCRGGQRTKVLETYPLAICRCSSAIRVLFLLTWRATLISLFIAWILKLSPKRLARFLVNWTHNIIDVQAARFYLSRITDSVGRVDRFRGISSRRVPAFMVNHSHSNFDIVFCHCLDPNFSTSDLRFL